MDTPVEMRLCVARRLLGQAGIRGEVSAAGMDGEIAAVRCAPDQRVRLTALAPEIRSLGFRYVALEPNAENHDDEES